MFRFGVVGAGAIGAAHKEALLAHAECDIAAVCDLSEEKAAALAEGTNARVYTDYKAMQEQEAPDAVILNLPHFLHQPVSVYFLEKHVPVLVEKPMANTVAECDAMIAAAERTGTILAVGHVQRYYPCYRMLKEIIREGRLGRLCAVTEVRNVNYFPNRPKWFLDKKQSGGGILMNYGAHTLDKLMYSTGLTVEAVTAAGNNFLTEDNVEATAQVLVRLTGGVSASFTYCGCHVPGTYETNFYFTDGVAQVRGGSDLWIAEGAQKEFVRADSGNAGTKLITEQLVEFVKLLKGEENEMVLPAYGREVVAVLEEAFRQM